MATHPRLLFDPYNQRWILSCLGNESSSSAQILLAVSATSDPTGNWYVFSVYVDPQNYYYYNLYYIYGDYATADYISMGFNKQWIVVTANMLPLYFSGFYYNSTYSGANVFVFDKMSLYTNGTGSFTILEAPGDYRGNVPFSMVPSVNYDESAPEMYLAEVDGMMGSYALTRAGTRLRLSKLTGEVLHPLLQIGLAFPATGANWGNQDTSFAGLGAQQGSPQNIPLNDARIQNLVYRNGTLWCTHTVFLPTLSPRSSSVQWWQLSTNGAVLQSGRIEDTTGVRSYAFPSLAVNHCNDVLVGYSGFATNQYASAYYSFRSGSDPVNTFRDPRLYKAGLGPYEQQAFGTNFVNANTWGNYSATVVDPANDLDLWTLQEYADTPSLGGAGRWGAWWASVDAASITPAARSSLRPAASR